MYTESELREIFTSLVNAHRIKLIIDPPEYVAFLPNPISVDVEHNEAGELVGVGVCNGSQCDYFTKITPRLIKELLQAEIIAHNGISDLELLRTWGIPVKNEQLVWDTFLMGHILDSSLKTYGLKDMAKRELGIEYPDYSDIVGKKTAKERKTLDLWPVDVVAMYNACDTFSTWKLAERQKECIAQMNTSRS